MSGYAPPCVACKHLVTLQGTPHGVRCRKGDTSDQCGDFSCYEAVPPKGADDKTIWDILLRLVTRIEALEHGRR